MAELLVNIDVDDLEKAVAFYVRALDLQVGRKFDGMVELLGAQAPIYLLEKKSGTGPFGGATRGRSYERHWTPVHLDVVVRELAPAVERAVEAGAWLEGEAVERSWGSMALMSDPFGHGFCLIQFRGRGYDEIALQGR
jgi:lactoylglutathione lyase